MKHIPDNYLVEWYIGVAKRRGWDEVVRLLKQYPKDEERMKTLIKKRLGHERPGPKPLYRLYP